MTMKNKLLQDSPDAQKREIAYPAYPLDEALKVADAVRELGGARSAVAGFADRFDGSRQNRGARAAAGVCEIRQ